MPRLTICLTSVLIGLATTANAENFSIPFSGKVYFEVVNAKKGADWTFGIGTTAQNCRVYLASLPDTSYPRGEVLANTFASGDVVHFCMWSKYDQATAWAFSDGTDQASRIAFGDTVNGLRMGGKVIEQTGSTTWLMHLDNAVSYLFDDSNDDILIKIRIETALVTGGPPAQDGCTNASLKGAYGYAVTGFAYNPDLLAFAASGRFVADGAGDITGVDSVSYGGTVQRKRKYSGTYSITSDCTGVMSFSVDGLTANSDIVLTNSGRELHFIQTDPGTIISGSAKQQ